MSAVRNPGESPALAEYLSGREELATLIANVEARLPGPPEAAVEPAPVAEVVPAPVLEVVPEVEPEVAPEPVAAAEAAAGTRLSDDSAAPDAQALSDAVEKVTRASELIAQSCALFTETVDADRAELRALADAVMTLARAIGPAPSTPRLVGGNVFAGPTRAREHDIVMDDDRRDTSVPAPASASVPTEKPGSAAPRPATASPRPANWSSAQTTSPPTSRQPPPPRLPGNRSS